MVKRNYHYIKTKETLRTQDIVIRIKDNSPVAGVPPSGVRPTLLYLFCPEATENSVFCLMATCNSKILAKRFWGFFHKHRTLWDPALYLDKATAGWPSISCLVVLSHNTSEFSWSWMETSTKQTQLLKLKEFWQPFYDVSWRFRLLAVSAAQFVVCAKRGISCFVNKPCNTMEKQRKIRHASCRIPFERYLPMPSYRILCFSFSWMTLVWYKKSKGEQASTPVPHKSNIFRYSLFEIFLALVFRGSVMAASLW